MHTYTQTPIYNTHSLTHSLITDLTCTGIMAELYINDTTMPFLRTFSVDMNDGIITLTFDETVNISTFDTRQLTLVDSTNPVTNYTIFDFGTLLTNDNSPIVSFQLTENDLNAIKFDSALFTTVGTSFLTLTSDAVIDMSGNVVSFLVPTTAVRANNYTEDSIAPNLVSFVLNLNASTISLTFDEAVNLDDFNPSVITLMNGPDTNFTQSYQIEGVRDSEFASNLGTVITFNLSITDAIELKAYEDFATEPNNTFLQTTDQLVTDTRSGMGIVNRNVPIILPDFLQAGDVITDDIPPRFVQFVEFDLDTGTLQLRFNEPVNVSSIQFDRILLSPFPSASPSDAYNLVGAGASYVDGFTRTVIEIQLSDEDIFFIKLNNTLATSEANTNVRIRQGAILDQAGNEIEDSDVLSVQMFRFIDDTTGPRVLSFSLDMNTGILILTFNDILQNEVAIGSRRFPIDVTGITIQRDATGTQVDDRVQLTEQQDLSDITNSTNGYVILIFIPLVDLNALKANELLATNENNTYLTLTAETVDDVNGNEAIPIVSTNALRVSRFVSDAIRPELRTFNLDIDGSGSLTLSFSETVFRALLNTSQITLVGSNNETFTISSDDFVLSPPSPVVDITLGEADLNEIKSRPNLASLSSNIFIVITSQAVNDIDQNPLIPITADNPRGVTVYTQDDTSPELRYSHLDLNTGILNLTFTETINGSSFDPTGITLQNTEFNQGTDLSYTLTGGDWDQVYTNFIELRLAIQDLNEIKRMIGLGDDSSTSYLSLTSSTLRDMNSNLQSNPIVEITTFAARMISDYTFDETPPMFVGYTLNLTAETLELTFDETVNASSLMIDQITIHSEPTVREIPASGSGMGLDFTTQPPSLSGSGSGSGSGSTPDEMEELLMFTTLTVGSDNSSYSRSTDSTVIIINLGPDDLNSLKVQTNLATGPNNTYASFPNTTIADMNDNLVVSVSEFEAEPVNAFYPDFIAPVFVRFDLNLTSETLLLTFSEVVNASSIDVTQFTLQGAFDSNLGLVESHTLSSGNNGSTTVSSDGTEIEINLGANDLNEIKRLTSLATSEIDTYLVMTSSAVRDMNINAVVPRTDGIDALQVVLFTEDRIAPRLAAFNLDMDGNILWLEFSETVNADTLNATQFTLVASNAGGGQNYMLTESSLTLSSDNTTIVVDIGREDLNAIKFLTELAQDADSTYLSLTESAILDMTGNEVVSVPLTNALPVSTYLADVTGPILQSFDLNLDSEILTLHFDETVNVSSIQFMYCTIQSSLPTGVHYNLSGGEVLGVNSPDVEIRLDFHDLNQLKLNTDLATGMNNTYLIVDMGAAVDLSLIPNNAFPASLRVTEFSEDQTSPMLLRFAVNLNLETLTLNFDEPVNASSLDTRGITLLDESGGASRYSLTGGTAVSDNGLQIIVVLSPDDLNGIKTIESLFVSLESSNIAITSSTISDMNGNPVVEITFDDAINGSSFVNDSTRPVVRAFDLDLDANTMTLEFVETVNTSSINFTGITLQQSSNTTNQYTLTSSRLLRLDDSTIVMFELTTNDLNAIKARQIALTNTTAWLTLENFTIFDQNMQPVVPLENGNTAIPVRNYTYDQVRPFLESYTLDLDADTLTFSFSETVNVLSTLRIGDIELLSEPDENRFSDPRIHVLGQDTNNTFSDDVYSPIVTIQLGRLDLNVIKQVTLLATNENNTYLSLLATAVADMNFNPVVPITVSDPLQVTVGNFIEDRRPPELEMFDLDMNIGQMLLYFSETVNITTFDVVQFTLQYVIDATDSVYTHTLSGGFTIGSSSPTILVDLNIPDLNEIKRITQLATDSENTYMRLTRAAIQDMNMNYVAPIPFFNGLQVSVYVEDTTDPMITDFDLNLSTERLILTFDETVNASSVDITGIVIQNSAFSDSVMRRLVGGTVLTLDDTVVEIQFDADDLNYIKSIARLATSDINTYLTLESYTIDDMNNNSVVEVINGRAIRVRSFTADDNNPVLLSFDFNLNEGQIHLTFNETVNTSTLNVEQITLQSDFSETENTTLLTFNSTANTFSGSPDWPIITVQIGDNDLNEIKRLTALATSENTTILSFTPYAIEDTSGNMLDPITLGVSNYTEDTTPPELDSFVFDLNTGQLHFTFSETVNVSTFNLTQISLQNYMTISSMNYMSITLRGGTILTPEDSTTVSIKLLKEDLDEVKAIRSLAMNRLSTFLSITEGTILDMNSNELVSIGMDRAMMASVYIPDITPPRLEEFFLDMNTGNLTLIFSETVDTLTLNFEGFLLQDARTANSTFQFDTSIQSPELHPTVYITISKSDLDLLKQNRQIGTSSNDTYIALNNNTISDTSGNAVVSIEDGSALQVEGYVRDSTPPLLEQFNLDVDSGVLSLSYSETINIYSLDPTKITLQNGRSIGTTSFTLNGGFVTPEDSTVGYVELTFDDLNEIKRIIDLATCTIDDTYLSLIANESLNSSDMDMTLINESVTINITNDVNSSGSGSGSGFELSGSGILPMMVVLELGFSSHVYDMAGNPVVEVHEQDVLQVSECIQDTTRPQLVNFTLNMLNSSLILTFDETVNSSTLDLIEITFFNDGENSTQFYQLTAGYATNEDLAGQVIIHVIISNTDLNELKRRDDLATEAFNTQLATTQYLVLDMNRNQNVEISMENATEAGLHIPDERSPILLSFELDLTLERLTMSFSETVNASMLNVTGITIHNVNFTSYRTLVGGVFLPYENDYPFYDPIVVIQLDQSDLNYIKSVTDLATDLTDTYLSVETFTIADMNRNQMEEVNSLMVSRFEPDNIPPQFVSFNLDIDSGELFLTFSETVNVSSLDEMEITLQADELSDPEDQLIFTSGNTSFDTFSNSPDWPEIVVQIGIDDLNEIKRLTQLATCNLTSYLVLTEFAIADMNGNLLVPVDNGNATQVSVFTPDTSEPHLVSLSLDLNTGTLQLTFNETVDFNSLNLTSVTIQNESFSDDISVQLTGGNVTNIYDSTVVDIQLDIDDLNEIKRIRSLSTSENNTYVSLLAVGILDMNANPVVMVNTTDAIQASEFQEDETDPKLVSFDIDMNTGMLILTFDETVEADSLDVTQITLQDDPLTPALNDSFTLTGGLTSTNDSTILSITFSFLDINEIKKIRNLASDINGLNTYISISNLTAVDMNNNPVVPIASEQALGVSNFTEDSTPPLLLGFDLDLNLGLLVLNFSETVNTLTFNVTQFTLQSAQNESEAEQMYTLTESYLVTGDDVVIIQSLRYFDLNTIKSLGGLATSPDDTFLSITEFAIRDMNGNAVFPIEESMAIQVDVYQRDMTRPLLEAYDLDMDSGELMLTFSETVNVSTLDVTEILFLNDNFNASQMFTLTDASYSQSRDWPIIVVQVGDDDLNIIKQLLQLAVSNSTTFIELTEFVIRDTADNMNLPLNATQVVSFTPDTTQPRLISFNLDLSLDVLTLSFSETVRAVTLDPTQLTFIAGEPLIGSASGSGSGSGSILGSGLSTMDYFTNYTLTGGENLPLSFDSTELRLKLTFEDRNELKRLTKLATSLRNTFVSITSDFINDTNVNEVVAINITDPLRVTNFTSDFVAPELLGFDLDMDSRNLTLYFSETVNVATLNVSGIKLQSSEVAMSGITEYYMLTDSPRPFGSHSASKNGPTVVVEIGETDSNRIKFLTMLAQSTNSTFISLTTYTILDMNRNLLVPVSELNATQVSDYLADVTGPVLRSFTLNLTSELLTLSFDETVDFNSIQPELITIQNAINYTYSYSLVSAVPIGENSDILELNLTATQQDLNNIKLLSQLATDVNNTFITLSRGAISDLALDSNAMETVTRPADEFYPDVTQPRIVSFSVNVNASTLTLIFDEVVNVSSLDPTAVRLQNSSSGPASYVDLTGELSCTKLCNEY